MPKWDVFSCPQNTYSLVQDATLTEEQDAISVKPFARPVRTHKVVAIYDDLAEPGKIIRKGRNGLKIFLDPNQQGKAVAIRLSGLQT